MAGVNALLSLDTSVGKCSLSLVRVMFFQDEAKSKQLVLIVIKSNVYHKIPICCTNIYIGSGVCLSVCCSFTQQLVDRLRSHLAQRFVGVLLIQTYIFIPDFKV